MAADNQAKERKIGLREIRLLETNSQIFDAGPGAVPAFGARRRAGAAVSYFVMFRTDSGRQRLFTIGQHGAPWTPDTARQKALAVLAEVKVKGTDPAAEKRTRREAATVSELCDSYWADAEAGRLVTRRGTKKKASTLTYLLGGADGDQILLPAKWASCQPILHDILAPLWARQDLFRDVGTHGGCFWMRRGPMPGPAVC